MLSGRVSEGELGDIRRDVESIESSLLQAKATILDLREKLIEAKNENVELREEVLRGERQIGAEESRSPEGPKYLRKRVRAAFLIVREDEPDVHYCPVCFENRQRHIVQPHPIAGRWCPNCPNCRAQF